MKQTGFLLLGMLALSASGCADELQCSGGQVEINGVCECPAGSTYRRAERICEAREVPVAPDAATTAPGTNPDAKPDAATDGGSDRPVVDAAVDADAPRVDGSSPLPGPGPVVPDASTSVPDARAPSCDGGPGDGPGCPAPAKPVTVRLEPSADSYVNATGANFGPHDMLFVDPQDGPQRVFLRFDLKSIPASAQVTRATLQMTAYEGYAYGGDGNCYVHLVTNDRWVESEINGTNQPMAEPDALGFWWLWYDQTVKDQQGTLTGEPLRTTVEQEVRGDRALSLRIHSPGYKTHYRAREFSNASQRPNLTVEYVAP